MAEFHFDFDAVAGLDYETGLKALLTQFETHYNATQAAPFVFGGPKPAAAANEPAAPVARPKVKVDTETITPKTIAMKSFAIRPNADGTAKMIVGVSADGKQIGDLLLPGYDEEPYGAVVSGEAGRYNLKGK